MYWHEYSTNTVLELRSRTNNTNFSQGQITKTPRTVSKQTRSTGFLHLLSCSHNFTIHPWTNVHTVGYDDYSPLIFIIEFFLLDRLTMSEIAKELVKTNHRLHEITDIPIANFEEKLTKQV